MGSEIGRPVAGGWRLAMQQYSGMAVRRYGITAQTQRTRGHVHATRYWPQPPAARHAQLTKPIHFMDTCTAVQLQTPEAPGMVPHRFPHAP